MAANLAQGTVFQMTISASLTAITDVVSIDGSNSTRDDIDVTNLSSGVQRDFLPGLIDPGTVTIVCNYDPDGSTHQAITDQYILTTSVACKIVWSDTTELPLTCYVKDVSFSASTGDKLQMTAVFKVSDAISWAT